MINRLLLNLCIIKPATVIILLLLTGVSFKAFGQQPDSGALKETVIKKLNKHHYKAHSRADTLVIPYQGKVYWDYADMFYNTGKNTAELIKDLTFNLAERLCKKNILHDVKETGYTHVMFNVNYLTRDHVTLEGRYAIQVNDLFLLCNNMNREVFYSLIKKIE